MGADPITAAVVGGVLGLARSDGDIGAALTGAALGGLGSYALGGAGGAAAGEVAGGAGGYIDALGGTFGAELAGAPIAGALGESVGGALAGEMLQNSVATPALGLGGVDPLEYAMNQGGFNYAPSMNAFVDYPLTSAGEFAFDDAVRQGTGINNPDMPWNAAERSFNQFRAETPAFDNALRKTGAFVEKNPMMAYQLGTAGMGLLGKKMDERKLAQRTPYTPKPIDQSIVDKYGKVNLDGSVFGDPRMQEFYGLSGNSGLLQQRLNRMKGLI